MTKIFSRRQSKSQFNDALISLQRAFEEEAARQRLERIEYARFLALRERERVLQTYPISWPATIAQYMTPQYGEMLGHRAVVQRLAE